MESYNKAALLEKVRASRADFEALLGQFPRDGLESAYPPDGWSVKDMMAHIAHWDAHALVRFQAAAAGVKPEPDTLTDADLDRINQELLDAGPTRPLHTVQASYAQVYQDLWAALQAMPTSATDPWWDLWTGDAPLDLIGYCTYQHYADHANDLRRWLAE